MTRDLDPRRFVRALAENSTNLASGGSVQKTALGFTSVVCNVGPSFEIVLTWSLTPRQTRTEPPDGPDGPDQMPGSMRPLDFGQLNLNHKFMIHHAVHLALVSCSNLEVLACVF